MVATINWSDPQLMRAVFLWTGYGETNSPRRDKDFMLQNFGEDSERWLAVVESLADEFYESNASFEAADIQEMWRMVIADFKEKYPSVPEDIAKAFAWCFTFDNR
ncbi:MAG: hypothetical protein Q8L72_00995 [Moraxellaceae bacterium]|nr:hypothetical protein [Moraxellaceae bacterium]